MLTRESAKGEIFDKLDSLKMKKGCQEKLTSDLGYLHDNGYLVLIDKIYLFGSCSKGKETYKSDIDLGIVTKTPIPRKVKADIRGELTDPTQFGIETNCVFIQSKNLDLNIRLHREIVNGIRLY